MQLTKSLSAVLLLMVLIYFCATTHLFAKSSPDGFQEALQRYEEKAYSQAVPLLRTLVKAGDDRAMVLLAQMYQFGEGVSTNPAKSLELLIKSAAKNNAQAQYLLAGHYLGGKEFKQDFGKAFELNMKAALQGHKLAQLTVGQALLNGIGDEMNICQARVWLQKAAMQGDAEANRLMIDTEKSECPNIRGQSAPGKSTVPDEN